MPRYVDLNNPKIIHMGRDKFGDGIYHIIGVPIPPDLPTAEVVEVVRCKDCKHRPDGTGVNHDLEFPDDRCPCKCEDYWYSWKPDDNWFCGNGERRE